ncbi:MAG: anhydro-N-acetylmuramic acid kinase [Elusimicrobia bacterium]|nr:anhydro-N-acetylmuramic acid kinase [Candidatus Obscuribacterium magneticum]
MKSKLAIGLMSGTSADSVSAVLASFMGDRFNIIEHIDHLYPLKAAAKIHKGGALTAAELSSLNFEIGAYFAEAALKLLKKARVHPKRITCVGSHGQTIYHGPRDTPPNTLQIGEPAVIAEKTGLPVVSDFRQADIAAGGEGAPLIPFFDHYYFGKGPLRAFQNIGGIANVAVVGKSIRKPLAFDTGPGNCLMDAAIRLMTRGRNAYDRNGERAKRGRCNRDAANRMLRHPYFKVAPPKSTGLEVFNMSSLLRGRPDDVLATLNYFTCLSIQESYRRFIYPKYKVKEVIVSGGGAFNKTLMKNLASLLAPIPVRSIETMGIPAKAKEPLAFAFFGLRAFHGQINHLPECTGAKSTRVLGKITGRHSGGSRNPVRCSRPGFRLPPE